MDTRPLSGQQRTPPLSASAQASMLPQYGFGATYTFEALVQQHHFLYRVHTPKNKNKSGSNTATLSRSASPSPGPSLAFSLTSSPRSLSSSLYSTPNKPSLSRSPSSALSASLSASVSSVRSDTSDYFGFGNVSVDRSTLLFTEGKDEDEDDTGPNDPYFLSRRFKDELSSPDVHQRRRTLSTLSTLSGGSGLYTYVPTDDEEEPGQLSGSSSLNLGPKSRPVSMGSPIPERPNALHVPTDAFHSHQGSSSSGISHHAEASEGSVKMENESVTNHTNTMTYNDLVRHLDWTTRSSSPYVTTSFSFFWCLWEAVRRYKLGVKHDVEIAVIDARRVQGRAKTALEVLRSADDKQQDKAYWKWYRFALESQDVLVFGAIPGDAVYTSVPLISLLPRLPSYFFNARGSNSDIPRGLSILEDLRVEDPREPDPVSMEDMETKSIIDLNSDLSFPTTPAHPRKRTVSSSSRLSQSLSRDIITFQERSFAAEKGKEWEEEKRREEERDRTRKLLAALAWDVGTSLKPSKKSRTGKEGDKGRHTTHRDFCGSLQKSFLAKAPDTEEGGNERVEADRMKDATEGAVRLAETLIEPWFRARCTMNSAQRYPFRHGDSDSESEDEDNDHDSGCLGLSGDGCSLLSHSKHQSLSDSMNSIEKEDDEDEESELEVAKRTLIALACELSRWPAGWWFDEHRESVETGINKAVEECAHDAAQGASERFGKGVEQFERETRMRTVSLGSVRSFGSLGKRSSSGLGYGSPGEGRSRTLSYVEPRGREESRSRSRTRARSPVMDMRRASEGSPLSSGVASHSPSRKPWPMRRSSSSATEKYRPRARSPLGMTPALGPAIVLQPKGSKVSRESAKEEERRNEDDQPWELNTPPPTPPLAGLNGAQGRRSPPPPPPPRSSKRRANSPSPSPPEGDVFSPPTQTQQLSTPPHSRNASVSSTNTLVEDLGLGTPLSLGVAASSVMGLHPTGSSPASLSGSRKSSSESLSSALGFGSGLSITPTPSPLRNQTRRSSGHGVNEMALLSEVVQTAFGLGASALAGSAAQDLRLETNSSPEKQERIFVPSHHRRHSMQSIVLESELSPVRENAQEEDEAEQASLEEERKKREEEERNVQKRESMDSLKAISSEDIQMNEISMPGAYFTESDGTPLPEEDMIHSHSTTLASIPEDTEEWMFMEPPNLDSASMYGSMNTSFEDDMSLGRTLEDLETLPKEPTLEPTILEDDINVLNLPLEENKSNHALRTWESLDSLDSEYNSNEMYVPRELPTSSEAKYKSVEVATEPVSGPMSEPLSIVVPTPENDAPLSPTPHSIIRALFQSRAFLRALLILPLLSYLRPFAHSPSASSPSTSTGTASPVFEDDDPTPRTLAASIFLYIRSRIRYVINSKMSRKSAERSKALILGPRPAWDSPILDTDGRAYGTGNSLANRRGAGYTEDNYRSSRWAMSCFVCGIMATLALATIHQRREASLLVGNRFT